MNVQIFHARFVADVKLHSKFAPCEPRTAELSALLPALGLLVEHLTRHVVEHDRRARMGAAAKQPKSKEAEHADTDRPT